jgi:hypothetical protein
LKIGATEQGEVVEAEGFAPNDPKDILATKRAALVDAQRNAVEKAVGVFVSGRTLVEKAIAIENNILARTEGYVKKYDILSEGLDKDLYKIKIRALVALKDLEKDLKAMSLLNEPELKRPRVSMKLDETIDGVKAQEAVASNALKQSLLDQGFIVVADTRVGDAELSIVGSASSLPFQDQGLGGFVSFRARLSLQVLRSGTDTLVTSISKEASGLGGNKTLAGFKSLETVGNLVGRELGEKLTQMWSKGGNLFVLVEGVKTFTDAERVRKHLMSQPGVKDLMMRLYEEQMAQFELQVGSMPIEELAAHLQASQTLSLTVVEAKNQTLRLKLN